MLAEDTDMVRGALTALLEREPDIEVVAEVERGDLVEEAARRTRPDVAILDVDMPGMSGIEAAVRLAEAVPATNVLLLTNLGQPAIVRQALAAKVEGFLLKDSPPGELAEAVRKVARGERMIDPELVLAAWDTGDSPLTARETEVLQLAANGFSVSRISAHLHLSPGTVRNYLTAAVTKLNADNRLHAVHIARAAGWLS